MKDRCLHCNGPQIIIQSVSKNLLNRCHTFIAVLILSVLFTGSIFDGQLFQPALANQNSSGRLVEPPADSVEIHVALELSTPSATVIEPVQVTASGVWMNGCTPRYSTHSIDRYKVRIFAIAEDDGPCSLALEEWSFPVTFDLADVGTYDIDIYAISEGMPGYQLQTSMPLEVGDGTVQDSQVTELIAYSPANPEAEDDVVVTVEGINSDGCVPEYKSHEMLTGNKVMIDAAKPVDMVCGQVITPWSFDTNIGKLGAGIYSIEVYVTSELGVREHYQTSSMSVSTNVQPKIQMERQFYIPAVVFQ